MSGEGITRRQFCAAGGTAAVLVGLAGAGAFQNAQGTVYLRPPGAVSETHLLAHCDRCQRCVQACPYDLVQPRPLTVDFPTTGTPELLFKNGYCDFCMKCVEVCPTGALSFEAPTADNIGVAKVISDSCVAWDWGGCTVCADECPVEGAITLDERGRPHVSEDLCDGCGLCELVCPAPSLRAYDPATLPKGIYVASRASEAAVASGALTSAQFESAAGKEAGRE
ncbi:4Fe-4S dicluster domain-containing protein [Adlercreutzia sp. R25]|uniref:4Fe-4S dicluster domain-containing protein n=1 Tax=Adlercreutzia shanghongiae TaxID=3111773 RepID=UPI002DBC1B1C|nr:4Fe-4S dicluster domain-containing protein [Adlercreutzia sp. R25]MEC4273575.1 4Fe-4S dicluster domain-containing protein [Adlercreutzia sp. R25]